MEEFEDDIEHIDENGWGSVAWYFDEEVDFFDGEDSEEGKEQNDGKPLDAELVEDELVFGSDGFFAEVVDDGVELIHYEI